MKRYGRGALVAAAFVLVASARANAQVCLGYPTMDGQFAIAGAVTFNGFADIFSVEDGATTYGGSVNANLTGPISLDVGYQLTDFDDVDTNGNRFFGRLAYELPVASLSVCPFAGASYFKISEEASGIEASLEVTTIPIGLGIGKRLPAGEALFVDLYAQPQYLYNDASVELGGDGGFLGASGDESDFGAALGANIGSSVFYAGASVFLSTIEDVDPVFSIRAGFVLGGR